MHATVAWCAMTAIVCSASLSSADDFKILVLLPKTDVAFKFPFGMERAGAAGKDFAHYKYVFFQSFFNPVLD
jgi:hypothetical protein